MSHFPYPRVDILCVLFGKDVSRIIEQYLVLFDAYGVKIEGKRHGWYVCPVLHYYYGITHVTQEYHFNIRHGERLSDRVLKKILFKNGERVET